MIGHSLVSEFIQIRSKGGSNRQHFICHIRYTLQVGFTVSIRGQNAQTIQDGTDETCQIVNIGSLRQVFGNSGTGWTPAQSIAIVGSTKTARCGLQIFASLLSIAVCFAKLILPAYTGILGPLSRPNYR
jgi:hypothetical protein